MFDQHLDGEHSLSYYVHGPEWAFAIPHGDFDALQEVLEICSQSWNGSGSLILPVDRAGRLPRSWRNLVANRPLDNAWLHPALSRTSREALQDEPSLRALEWGFGRGFATVHPADLIPPATARYASEMLEPDFETPALRRVSAVAWGTIGYRAAWDSRFATGRAGADTAFLALLGGQLGLTTFSPLRVSQTSMRVFGQLGKSQPFPYLWIFEDGSFDELVAFWNFRSTADAKNGLASVVGLPHQALRASAPLDALRVWADATSSRLMPSILVRVSARRVVELERVLREIGIRRQPTAELVESRGGNEPQTASWLPRKPTSNGPIVRGAWDTTTYAVRRGRGSVRLERPRGYRPTGGASIVMQTLRLPLPVTPSAAASITPGGYRHERGVGINMATSSPWTVAVDIPDEWAALDKWAGDYGYSVREPRPAGDARAVLQRLADPDLLGNLASAAAVDVLSALAPLSRDRLVKRLAQRFAGPVARQRLAEELTDALREDGLLLEVDGRTIEQLVSRVEHVRRAVVTAVERLTAAGFIQRGRQVTCPTCRFKAFLELHDLDETVRCRACGSKFLLPVVTAEGKEAETSYRVDGLMARVLDQHVLPVLLTVHALRKSSFPLADHFWPGVLFRPKDGAEFDVDLVASTGREVYLAECKLDGRSLKLVQLRRLLALADETGSRPVVAALVGDFSSSVHQAIAKRDGLVLTRDDLINASSAERAG